MTETLKQRPVAALPRRERWSKHKILVAILDIEEIRSPMTAMRTGDVTFHVPMGRGWRSWSPTLRQVTLFKAMVVCCRFALGVSGPWVALGHHTDCVLTCHSVRSGLALSGSVADVVMMGRYGRWVSGGQAA